ncbi:superoxide dismutase [Amycolatopsis antarctica]|uniref:Superoxide dismutase n=1 Tax=Amycolatopsis antarctica TaxID=1854586 RepID=A0A263CYG6_9PSEU|nr:superoxide dismutase [Amycolatopsis antarctica]OZM70145.1 superoxide dismutase [Amycolatopsis antarctica]
MRRLLPTVMTTLLATSAALIASTGSAAAASEAPRIGVGLVHAGGTFAEFAPGAAASTYDQALVPVGAQARVVVSSRSFLGTTTLLSVRGLVPDREYGAHAHTKPCGATGDAAGPHFQHEQDPVTPSVDPAYANPDNEIWLDLTTDAVGNAVAVSTVDWGFDERRAMSVVIHETHTHTDPGHAGMAGKRPACVNVAF